ncbi:MAG: hypothetical protein K6G58_06735 [Lachnospiraceae bacterium]|nr:hypothetical protein [Lachnospiraceae bacterium]
MNITEKFVSDKTALQIERLYPKAEARRITVHLGREKSRMFFGLVTVTVIAFAVLYPLERRRLSEPVIGLARNEYGQGDRTVTLIAVTEDGYEETLTVDVAERKYTEKQLKAYAESLNVRLWEEILAQNADSEDIEYDLDLKAHFEGFPFDVKWKSDRPDLIGKSGAINSANLAEADPEYEGVAVQLCATLIYDDYSEDRYSQVILRRRTEHSAGTVSESVKEYGELTETEKSQMLPRRAGDRKVYFYDVGLNRGWAVLFIGLMLAFLTLRMMDGRIKKKFDDRSRQMEADYYGILNQYMLYHLAGMNPRAIWTEICRKYEGEVSRSEKNRRYAYEEMVNARSRMDEGCGELEAYEEFSKRCDSVRYRSFICFVKQAVIKGSDGLSALFLEEMDKAERDKNNRVKMEASEAETKLLLPMFMMLLVVLAVVMVPAFWGLSG